MPTTPILGITQVSPSQANKEATINDAIEALESATNAKLAVDFTASNSVLLSDIQATRSVIYVAENATADCTLRLPAAVNGVAYNRLFVMRNRSGFGLTVQIEGSAGTTVVIPDNATRLLATLDGVDVIVAAQPGTALNFLALADVPNSYTGVQGKFLGVNVAEDALVFLDAATFPAYAGNAGKYLVVNATENGVEWVDFALDLTYTDLNDTPASYVGSSGRFAAVNSTEDGMEFVDAPEAEAVEFISAERWRVVAVEPGTESQVGFGEVEFLDRNGFPFTPNGVASAASFATGNEAELAFDGITDPGNGWLSDELFVGTDWIEYDYDAPVSARSVRLTGIGGFPGFTPTRVQFEYFNGDVWVEVGERLTAPWVDGVSQTFKINGVNLQSVVPDAPADGQKYLRRNNAWESFFYSVPMGFVNSPEASETMLIHCFSEAAFFPDEFADSQAYIGTPPLADYTLSVAKISGGTTTVIGTVTITPAGAVTFATTNLSESFAVGDVMTITAQGSQDTGITNCAFTFKGIRQ